MYTFGNSFTAKALPTHTSQGFGNFSTNPTVREKSFKAGSPREHNSAEPLFRPPQKTSNFVVYQTIALD